MKTLKVEIAELDAKELRKFAFIMAAMIAALFGLLLPYLLGFQFPWWPWLLALLLLGWGVMAPASLMPLYRLWMYFGMMMNRLTTPLILGLIFFLLILPLGWFVRTFMQDSMTIKTRKNSSSYRIKSRARSRQDMEKPF